MSKKARINKKIRRKMMAVWRKNGMQKELDQCFSNLLTYGFTAIASEKNGRVRMATAEEIEELVRNGEIVSEIIRPYDKDFIKNCKFPKHIELKIWKEKK